MTVGGYTVTESVSNAEKLTQNVLVGKCKCTLGLFWSMLNSCKVDPAVSTLKLHEWGKKITISSWITISLIVNVHLEWIAEYVFWIQTTKCVPVFVLEEKISIWQSWTVSAVSVCFNWRKKIPVCWALLSFSFCENHYHAEMSVLLASNYATDSLD